jgi:PAS domain S-box-containing protein
MARHRGLLMDPSKKSGCSGLWEGLPFSFRLAWLPLPLLAVAVVWLWASGSRTAYASPLVANVLNCATRTLASLVIMLMAGGAFLRGGARSMLWFGCGVAIWGSSGAMATAMLKHEPNLSVTISSIGLALMAFCHLAGVLSSRTPLKTIRGAWLAFGYLASFAVVGLVIGAVFAGWVPEFFVQGEGGTLVRHVALGWTVVMLLMAAWLLWRRNQPQPSHFVRWYFLALLLVATSVAAMSLERQSNSAMAWVSRAAMYLGGLYMLLAAASSVRKSGLWGVSLESALRKAEQHYQDLLALAADGVLVHELPGPIAEGAIDQANPALCHMLGYEAEELKGMTLSDLMAPGEGPAVPPTAALVPRDTPLRSERMLLARDGRRIPTEIHTRCFERDGRLMAMSVIRDFTERRQSEEALRRSEALANSAVQVAGLGIFEHDHRSDVITFSPIMRELLGFDSEQEITIAAIVEQVLPEDRPALAEAIRRAHEPAGDGKFEIDYRVPLPGNRIRWICARSQTFFEGEGSRRRPVRTVGAARDATERNELQGALENLVEERTRRLQELVSELEHFSYTIAHDMRAPLRAMKGFAEIAQVACENDERVDYLKKISSSAERMDCLITDALNYSRTMRQEFPLTEVDTGELVRGILDTYPEFQASRAHIRIDGQLPVVLGNKAGLTQCFSNLLGNAVKFVRPGEMPEIRISAEEGGGRVRIWVKDKGIGISECMLPKVFEMFMRESNRYEGTGIGLALVRKVAQRMGGTVGVESEEGKGSGFWLELCKDRQHLCTRLRV